MHTPSACDGGKGNGRDTDEPAIRETSPLYMALCASLRKGDGEAAIALLQNVPPGQVDRQVGQLELERALEFGSDDCGRTALHLAAQFVTKRRTLVRLLPLLVQRGCPPAARCFEPDGVPAALGPAALGPTALGSAALGPAALGPAALGSAALGSAALGPSPTRLPDLTPLHVALAVNNKRAVRVLAGMRLLDCGRGGFSPIEYAVTLAFRAAASEPQPQAPAVAPAPKAPAVAPAPKAPAPQALEPKASASEYTDSVVRLISLGATAGLRVGLRWLIAMDRARDLEALSGGAPALPNAVSHHLSNTPDVLFVAAAAGAARVCRLLTTTQWLSFWYNSRVGHGLEFALAPVYDVVVGVRVNCPSFPLASSTLASASSASSTALTSSTFSASSSSSSSSVFRALVAAPRFTTGKPVTCFAAAEDRFGASAVERQTLARAMAAHADFVDGLDCVDAQGDWCGPAPAFSTTDWFAVCPEPDFAKASAQLLRRSKKWQAKLEASDPLHCCRATAAYATKATTAKATAYEEEEEEEEEEERGESDDYGRYEREASVRCWVGKQPGTSLLADDDDAAVFKRARTHEPIAHQPHAPIFQGPVAEP